MAGVLTADVGGIQDWIVGGASELRVLRGGSLLLDEAFAEIEKLLEETQGRSAEDTAGFEPGVPLAWSLIVRSSGSLTVLFASEDDARTAAIEVSRHLRGKLPGLTLQVGAAPVDDPHNSMADAGGRTPFQRAVTEARNAAAEATGAAAAASPVPTVPGARLCAACGQGNADPQGSQTSHGRTCPACTARLRVTPVTDDAPDGTRVATEFGEIGRATRASRYRGYIGVISADGNAIGRRFMDKRTPGELAEESRAVTRDVDAAVEQALVTAAGTRDDGDPLPYSPVIRAGDDLCLVVPADVALRTAAALCTARPSLSVSAGVLLCHDSLPFSLAREAADALLRDAKRVGRLRGTEVAPQPHVAFRVESGSAPGDDPVEALTASPYPATAIGHLLEAAGALDLRGSAASNLLIDLLGSRRGGRRAWRTLTLTRLARAQRDAVEKLFTELDTDPSSAPWLDEETARSPVGDLVLARQLGT